MFNKLVASKLAIRIFASASLFVFMSACSSMSTTDSTTADISERWAVLPINNISQTAQADVQVQTLVETQLRKRGVRAIETYAPTQKVSLRNLLDPASDLENALDWAKRSGFRYGLTGIVNEWHYKAGADKEPAVGISLKLIDLQSEAIVWQANAARTGWGYASLPAVADKVVRELLHEVQLRAPRP